MSAQGHEQTSSDRDLNVRSEAKAALGSLGPNLWPILLIARLADR